MAESLPGLRSRVRCSPITAASCELRPVRRFLPGAFPQHNCEPFRPGDPALGERLAERIDSDHCRCGVAGATVRQSSVRRGGRRAAGHENSREPAKSHRAGTRTTAADRLDDCHGRPVPGRHAGVLPAVSTDDSADRRAGALDPRQPRRAADHANGRGAKCAAGAGGGCRQLARDPARFGGAGFGSGLFAG